MVSACLCTHACAQCAFMHGVVSVRCVCMCVWILFMVKKKEALRPAASWSNWHFNHVSVGGISVCMCVCERSKTYLQRQRMTAGVLSSSPSCSDTPMARVSVSWREIGSKESEPQPITWVWVQIKHFSMCVVMRSCVFVCELSVSGLLPLVCWLGRAFLLCWCLDVFSCSFPPTQYPQRQWGKDEESHTLFTLRTPVSHGRMTSLRRMQGHEGRENKLCQNTGRQQRQEKEGEE